VFDFHCHLDLYRPSEELLTRIKAAEFILAVTTTPLAVEGNKARFGGFPGVRIGCGLHPELVLARSAELPVLLDQIREEIFVGEVGLDGSSAHRSNLQDQMRVFNSVVRQCHFVGGRIVSIHSRGAVKQVLDILEGSRSVGCPVFHWFSGTPQQALRAVKLGGYFSVNDPAVLSRCGRQWIEAVPKSRIVTETDGPFCEVGSRSLWPGETSGAVSALGSIWNLPYEDVCAQIRENSGQLLAGTGS
jgi:TatD DNase family protein